MALTSMVWKVFDAIVFIFVIYYGSHYYRIDHLVFDLITLAAVAYIAFRKPDVNTLTLVFILLVASFIPAALIYSNTQLGNGWLHSILFLVNAVGAVAIWSRTFLLLKHGPLFIKKHADYINPNRQDTAMGLLFTLQAFWQLLQFAEHAVRHRAAIGLGELFGDWSPMMFYDMYKTGQFGFGILTLLILYFMTFEQSKLKR